VQGHIKHISKGGGRSVGSGGTECTTKKMEVKLLTKHKIQYIETITCRATALHTPLDNNTHHMYVYRIYAGDEGDDK
jgi:hypothetical protein